MFLRRLFVLSIFFVATVLAQVPIFDVDSGRLDPISARRFQEDNGLPEDPNSVFPAQALVRPAPVPSGPANRIATPIFEENGERDDGALRQVSGSGILPGLQQFGVPFR